MNNVAAIVLAAGKGTRMNSQDKNKVVLQIDKKPMVSYTVDNLRNAGIEKIIVVVGYASESVKEVLKDSVEYAFQPERLGTGHAVNIGLSKVPKDPNHIVSIQGDDSAFYPPSLIRDLINLHMKSASAITLLTIKKQNPAGLGRIVRDKNGLIKSIVEEKNATDEQKQIKEINTGLYCFDRKFLEENINKIEKNSISGEYYQTDLVENAVKKGLPVNALFWEDSSVWHGVNTLDQLEQARKRMSEK